MKSKIRYWQTKSRNGQRAPSDGRKLFENHKNNISAEFAQALNLDVKRTPSISPDHSLSGESNQSFDSIHRRSPVFMSLEDSYSKPFAAKRDREYANLLKINSRSSFVEKFPQKEKRIFSKMNDLYSMKPNKSMDKLIEENLRMLEKNHKRRIISQDRGNSLEHLPMFNKQVYTKKQPKYIISNPISLENKIFPEVRRKISNFRDIIVNQPNYYY
ncbi:unnamed protein product [Blepharisma stoltei]|uniref:Uncharacterized protein n=1 Tax=Blepharisma stoltei TaxID=1481888 RepID=A0AAU9JGX4_9CILI|nr:unnamed protein product [Blepharisma stoltei]